MPVTIPVPASTVAAAVLLLLQVPPVIAFVIVTVAPTQPEAGPAIADGAPVTLTVAVVLQPVPSVYVITAVPTPMPLTIPVLELTVATAALLLVHDSPGVVALVSAVVLPLHTVVLPMIAAGFGFTVITAVR